jgi:hypothetical protein
MKSAGTNEPLGDRQARNVILAAERHGFRREPDLHPRWYDALLHEDAEAARAFLTADQPILLAEALTHPETIPPREAAARIADGRASLADMERIIEAAEGLGFSVPVIDLPLHDVVKRFEQGEAAIAFLWEARPETLNELLGELALLAPTPDDAWFPQSL